MKNITEPQDVVTHSLTEEEISVEFGVNTKDSTLPSSSAKELSENGGPTNDT